MLTCEGDASRCYAGERSVWPHMEGRKISCANAKLCLLNFHTHLQARANLLLQMFGTQSGQVHKLCGCFPETNNFAA